MIYIAVSKLPLTMSVRGLYVFTILPPCQLEETLGLSRLMHMFYRMSEQNDFLLRKGQTSCAFCCVTLNNIRTMLKKLWAPTRRQRL